MGRSDFQRVCPFNTTYAFSLCQNQNQMATSLLFGSLVDDKFHLRVSLKLTKNQPGMGKTCYKHFLALLQPKKQRQQIIISSN
jgi:hypothetical protein